MPIQVTGVAADANGTTSLRAAIQEANTSTGLTRIRLPAGHTLVLTLAGAGEDLGATGDLDVSSRIKIIGNESTVIAAMGDRVFDVLSDGDLTIDELTIRDGESPDGENGGNIRNVGDLRIRDCLLADGRAQGAAGSGGNLFNAGDAEIEDCILLGGIALRAGGAIEADGGTTSITDTTVAGNTAGDAPGNGGGLHITGDGDAFIIRCVFDSNVAAREGGGAWNSVGTMSIVDSTFSNNVANGDAADDGGGGVFNNGGTLAVSDTDLLWNQAPGVSGSGGGLFSIGGMVDVTGGEISGNDAARAGGGVEVVDGVVDDRRRQAERELDRREPRQRRRSAHHRDLDDGVGLELQRRRQYGRARGWRPVEPGRVDDECPRHRPVREHRERRRRG